MEGGESVLDRMTHFDFKTLLPETLLPVEDRMSMAHGLESLRPPFLDHLRSSSAGGDHSCDVKFEGGQLSRRRCAPPLPRCCPPSIVERQDKTASPTPLLNAWAAGPARDFVSDILSSRPALERNRVDNRRALASLAMSRPFGRGFWGLLTGDLAARILHDRASQFRDLPARLAEGQVA